MHKHIYDKRLCYKRLIKLFIQTKASTLMISTYSISFSLSFLVNDIISMAFTGKQARGLARAFIMCNSVE